VFTVVRGEEFGSRGELPLERVMNLKVKEKAVQFFAYQALSLGWQRKHEVPEQAI
jgi:hypothetical protein